MTQTARDWELKFPYFVSHHEIAGDGLLYSTTFKFFFLTYWIILWIHGPDKLTKMSARSYLEREMNTNWVIKKLAGRED